MWSHEHDSVIVMQSKSKGYRAGSQEGVVVVK